MKLLIVNVNTAASMTEAIADSARSVAAPGTEIVGLTPAVPGNGVAGPRDEHTASDATSA